MSVEELAELDELASSSSLARLSKIPALIPMTTDEAATICPRNSCAAGGTSCGTARMLICGGRDLWPENSIGFCTGYIAGHHKAYPFVVHGESGSWLGDVGLGRQGCLFDGSSNH